MLYNRRFAAVASLLALGIAARPAVAQQTYPQTLYWGAGLIDIPVAWVSPVSGDFAANFGAQTFRGARGSPQIAVLNGLNTNGAISASFFGRAEIGLAIYSDNPEWGLFGQGLLLNEETFRPRHGLAHWIPSVAVGIRNVGPYDHVDRFTIGYELLPGTPADPDKRHVADSLHRGFSTDNTVYGVATKSFSLSELNSGWGKSTTISLTAGYGNGLFKDDGGLGDLYARHSWNGAFGGVKVDLHPTERSTLSFMAENNSWDYNLGANYDWRGIRIGAYWMEVGAGKADSTTEIGSLYNYDKFAFTLGWQSNVFALLRGNFLQDRVTQLEHEREQLVAEIAARQQRIAALELEINRYQAQNILDLEERRAAAEAELKAEREALQRLEERLRRLEQTQPPPQQTPPR